MEIGIALLLRGFSADLPATIQAIELAKRTTGVVHAIFKKNGKCDQREESVEGAEKIKRSHIEQVLAMASWLSDVKGIKIHIHMLESLADDLLVRFLCEYRIFCLITGVRNQQSVKRNSAWIERLRRQLAGDKNCFLPPLWSVIIQPWKGQLFEQIISGITGSSLNSPAMKMISGSLQNGLYRLNNITRNQKKSVKGGKNVHVPSDSSHQC